MLMICRRPALASLAMVAALTAAGGCFLGPTTVQSRFSGEFQCPQKQVKVEKLEKERFRATGCNRRAHYRCSGEYGEFCERVGQPETIRPQTEQEQPPGGEPAVPKAGE